MLAAGAAAALAVLVEGRARHLAREEGELVRHAVDGAAQAAHLAAQGAAALVQVDPFGEITVGHGGQYAGGLRPRAEDRLKKGVDRVYGVRPPALAGARRQTLVDAAAPYDFCANPEQL